MFDLMFVDEFLFRERMVYCLESIVISNLTNLVKIEREKITVVYSTGHSTKILVKISFTRALMKKPIE